MVKNWKTTLAGVIVAATGLAVYMHWITVEVSVGIIALAASLGFVVAKDNDVTGV